MTPLLVGAVRLIPAGALLVCWGASRGRPNPSGLAAWGAVTLFALIDGTAFQGCLAQGLQTTSAGLGSVIIDSQPLSVAVLSALFFGERLGLKGVVGLMIGVTGIALLNLNPEQIVAVTSYMSSTVGTASDVAQTAVTVATSNSGTSYVLL